MPRAARVAIGGLVLAFGLAGYCLLGMWIGAALLPEHWAAELAFYPVAGVAWIWPAALVIRWAHAGGQRGGLPTAS